MFGICLHLFPQNERKIYKLRQLSLYIFWGKFVNFSILNDESAKWIFLKSKHTSIKKHTNWTKLSCLSLYIFLSFWGNKRRQKPNIPHLRTLTSIWSFMGLTLLLNVKRSLWATLTQSTQTFGLTQSLG